MTNRGPLPNKPLKLTAASRPQLSAYSLAGRGSTMDRRTKEVAKRDLRRHADGFLDALRPYRGKLPEDDFHGVVVALRQLADCIRTDPIDREVLDILLQLHHTADFTALDPDGMLQRNRLITAEDQRAMRNWLSALATIVGRLVAGAEVENAFDPYERLCGGPREAG